MMISPHQCPGVEGKVCTRFLTSKENIPHRLCVSCCGKSCKINNHCEEGHDLSDDCYNRVSEYMHKLLLQ